MSPDGTIGRPFFASWSGGKDSCLALHRAIKAGNKPRFLFTMLTEDGERSRAHGLAREVIMAQAASLGVPAIFAAASWPEYEGIFVKTLAEMRTMGIDAGVFGDIDGAEHLAWVKRVCNQAGLLPWEPLWGTDRRKLLAEFISTGFTAMIVAVKGEILLPTFLGRHLDMKLVEELEALGIDASGEAGEYHTVVTGGPLFASPLEPARKGVIHRDGYHFLDLACQAGSDVPSPRPFTFRPLFPTMSALSQHRGWRGNNNRN